MKLIITASLLFICLTGTARCDENLSASVTALEDWFLRGGDYPSESVREAISDAYKSGSRDAAVLFWHGVIIQETFGDFIDSNIAAAVERDFAESAQKGSELAATMQVSMEMERTPASDKQKLAALILKLNQQLEKRNPLAARYMSQLAREGTPAFKKNPELAAKCAKLAIDLGDTGGYVDLALAQLDLGDPTTAMKTCTAGAAKGNRRASYVLGCWLRDGKLGPVDQPKASELFAKSAAKNYAEAMLAFAQMNQSSVSQKDLLAQQLLEQAAKTRKAARFELATSYIYETHGHLRDFRKAQALLEELVDLKYAPAQKELGIAYLLGIWIRQDFEKARQLLGDAASQGERDAKLLEKLLAGPNL